MKIFPQISRLPLNTHTQSLSLTNSMMDVDELVNALRRAQYTQV